MFQEKVKVLWNEELIPGYYKIAFECPQVCCASRPGQFHRVDHSPNWRWNQFGNLSALSLMGIADQAIIITSETRSGMDSSY